MVRERVRIWAFAITVVLGILYILELDHFWSRIKKENIEEVMVEDDDSGDDDDDDVAEFQLTEEDVGK